ncbi:nuclear transport factor 2 family protein [Aldersonia kunmingensis]|uniref:nuclear transport factor 2 family protein n=1 Tax=Aldersonia kunmingensis TaxID=408066 RepID=UPI000834583B|nr:nuclear transport factor 2 family protein [Aldersonia kunmingensis]
MGRFAREELTAAIRHYDEVVAGCSQSGDWSPFADLFTPDVEYIEHAYGVFHGRDAVRVWIIETMAPFPQMRIAQSWKAFDDENDAVVFGVDNILDHPTEPGVEFSFPNWSRVVYAGDGLFSSQEDVYNPVRDAPRVVTEWVRAGGKLLAPPARMQHIGS